MFSFFYFLLPTIKIIFSEKNIEDLFFFSLSKTKIISLKQKHFFFYSKEKKKIITINYLLIFEEEVYYALYCPLKSYLALELSI